MWSVTPDRDSALISGSLRCMSLIPVFRVRVALHEKMITRSPLERTAKFTIPNRSGILVYRPSSHLYIPGIEYTTALPNLVICMLALYDVISRV